MQIDPRDIRLVGIRFCPERYPDRQIDGANAYGRGKLKIRFEFEEWIVTYTTDVVQWDPADPGVSDKLMELKATKIVRLIGRAEYRKAWLAEKQRRWEEKYGRPWIHPKEKRPWYPKPVPTIGVRRSYKQSA